MQGWFTAGILPDESPEGLAARASLHLWPEPGKISNCEFQVKAVTPGGIVLGGYQDLEYFEPDGTPVVGDHKFTGDFKWAKGREELLQDPQANIYALASMQRHNASRVRLKWVYTRRKAPIKAREATETPFYIDRPQVDHYIKEVLEPLAKGILHLRVIKPEPETLPPSTDRCNAFGGCHYRNICPLTPQERMRGLMTETDLLQRLTQAASAANGINPKMPETVTVPLFSQLAATAVPAPTPPITGITAMTPPAAGTLLAQLTAPAPAPRQMPLPMPAPSEPVASPASVPKKATTKVSPQGVIADAVEFVAMAQEKGYKVTLATTYDSFRIEASK